MIGGVSRCLMLERSHFEPVEAHSNGLWGQRAGESVLRRRLSEDGETVEPPLLDDGCGALGWPHATRAHHS